MSEWATKRVSHAMLASIGGYDLADDDPDAHEECTEHCVKPFK